PRRRGAARGAGRAGHRLRGARTARPQSREDADAAHVLRPLAEAPGRSQHREHLRRSRRARGTRDPRRRVGTECLFAPDLSQGLRRPLRESGRGTLLLRDHPEEGRHGLRSGKLPRALREHRAPAEPPEDGVTLAHEPEHLATIGRGRTPAAPTKLVHHRIELQAAVAPEAIAVRFRDESLTYGELNRRANRLARHLVAAGIGPEGRGAVCGEPALDVVVALVAILKAGGGYGPLDLSPS